MVALSVSSRVEKGHAVAELVGDVDIFTAAKCRKALADLIDAGHVHLVVDLERLDFLDSSGLGVLVGMLRKARSHGGSLRLVCVRPNMLRLFGTTGLGNVFAIYPARGVVQQA
ncbi:MAG TPA: STAS domain-containing protein [Nocardioidaceae bacterium]|nr:STAS domain-containing protein [Nocardioidaceae bacterium]